MNITIIGASAGVGLETVHAALSRGHRVTTLSRTVGALPADKNLHVVQGTATSTVDVRRATVDADAVVVALGTKKLGATTLFSDAATVLVEAMAGREAPVIVVTGFGAGNSAQFQNPVLRFFMMVLLGRVYADKTRMENVITATRLAWEIVRPGRLSNASLITPAEGSITFDRGMNAPGISRKSLAKFLLDEAEEPRYPSQFVLPVPRP